jgi:CDP-6-deoxy-D-xylo-4-hexulose-3-dehydrase
VHEEFLIMPRWHEKADPSWFAFPLCVRDEVPFTRYQLTRFLEEKGVETRTLFAGNILMQPAYKNVNHRVIGDMKAANQIMKGAFFVGVYPGLDRPRLDYTIDAFNQFFQRL